MKLSGKLMIAPLVAIGFLVALALAGFYALTLQQAAADSAGLNSSANQVLESRSDDMMVAVGFNPRSAGGKTGVA